MKPKNKSKPMRPPVAGGTYLAVCVYSIDIGEQYCTYQDKSADYKDQVILGFELVGFTYEENGVQKPYDLGKTFTASMHTKAALRNFVQAWEGHELSESEVDAFDTRDLVGRTAMVSVILKENGFNDITGVFRIPAGIPEPTPTMPLISFDMEPWNQTAFDALPEWAQKKIKKSTQYQKDHAPNTTVTVQPMQMPNPMMGTIMQPSQGFGSTVPNGYVQPPVSAVQGQQNAFMSHMQQPAMGMPTMVGQMQIPNTATQMPNVGGQAIQTGNAPSGEMGCPI